VSHHPTPRESHLAHEDSRNELHAAQRLRDAVRAEEAARAEERRRIVERLLHWASLLDPDDVSRTSTTLEKVAAVIRAEGGAPA
jgi:hypothetical protein